MKASLPIPAVPIEVAVLVTAVPPTGKLAILAIPSTKVPLAVPVIGDLAAIAVPPIICVLTVPLILGVPTIPPIG